jgi:broad specificity phosphatase PhoE
MREAAELGAYFYAMGVRHILASPLERAWRTAHIAAAIAGAGVEQNLDIAEWRLDEVEKSVSERMQRAYALAGSLSAQHGPVALVSHGAPILTLLKDLGLHPAEAERHRIYDSRNPLPPAGAWQVAPDGLRLSFVPAGIRWPVTATL